MCCGQMQGHGLSVEGREHWYLCRPGVITMTLRSSLSSFIWCHVIKKCICGSLLNVDDPATETGLICRCLTSETHDMLVSVLAFATKMRYYPTGHR
jgi:hypothetical protein